MNLKLLAECALSAMLVNNIVLDRFLGLCPAIGATRRIRDAWAMGLAVTAVMTLGAGICCLIDRMVLIPDSLAILRLLVFMVTIASLVQVIELILQKWNSPVCDTLGMYLPLMASNCAVLGVILITTLYCNPVTGLPFSFSEMLVYCFFSGIGFTLVSLLMAGINLRLKNAPVAQALQGLPVALLSAGLLALAFCGFADFSFTP
jgi:Na+-translocating ferredoxin:NAD+ oxidoreductase subunit A